MKKEQKKINEIFFQACEDGDLEKVRYSLFDKSLEFNANINSYDERTDAQDDNQGLINALINNHTEVINYLLNHKENKNKIKINDPYLMLSYSISSDNLSNFNLIKNYLTSKQKLDEQYMNKFILTEMIQCQSVNIFNENYDKLKVYMNDEIINKISETVYKNKNSEISKKILSSIKNFNKKINLNNTVNILSDIFKNSEYSSEQKIELINSFNKLDLTSKNKLIENIKNFLTEENIKIIINHIDKNKQLEIKKIYIKKAYADIIQKPEETLKNCKKYLTKEDGFQLINYLINFNDNEKNLTHVYNLIKKELKLNFYKMNLPNNKDITSIISFADTEHIICQNIITEKHSKENYRSIFLELLRNNDKNALKIANHVTLDSSIKNYIEQLKLHNFQIAEEIDLYYNKKSNFLKLEDVINKNIIKKNINKI